MPPPRVVTTDLGQFENCLSSHGVSAVKNTQSKTTPAGAVAQHIILVPVSTHPEI